MAVATPDGTSPKGEEEEEEKFHEVLCIGPLWLKMAKGRTHSKPGTGGQYIVIYKGPDVTMWPCNNW